MKSVSKAKREVSHRQLTTVSNIATEFGVRPFPYVAAIDGVPLYDDQVSPTLTKSCFRASMGDADMDDGTTLSISSGGGCGNFRLAFHLSNGDGRSYSLFVDARDIAKMVLPHLREMLGTKWESRPYAQRWLSEHAEDEPDPDSDESRAAFEQIRADYSTRSIDKLEAIRRVREYSDMMFARDLVTSWEQEPTPGVTVVADAPSQVASPTPREKQPKDYELTEIYGPSARQYAEDDSLVIPQDALIGFRWTDGEGDEHEIEESRQRINGKRVATLSISTWRGISVGASHYYARIRAGVNVRRVRDGSSCSAALWVAPRANMSDDITIEVRRPIKRKEMDDWGRPLGKAGELTTRINSEEEARELGIATFTRRFGPGWILINENIYEDNDEVPLAETADVPQVL